MPLQRAQLTQPFVHYIDISRFELKAGDKIEYYFEVWDNDGVNGAKSARSHVMTFKAPTLEELDQNTEKNNNKIKDDLEESLKKAKELPKPKGRRRKKGEAKSKPLTRLERQQNMSLAEMLADLPCVCDCGGKRNSKGHTSYWVGYKLHLDVADGGLPISCLLTSASVNDSQVALPLATLTAQRVTNLYDLMDSAYDVPIIREHSLSLGHVPIIDSHTRRGAEKQLFAPHEAQRYKERSTVERVYARLKEEFGGRMVRVRGPAKVMTSLMFGIIALIADQLLRLVS